MSSQTLAIVVIRGSIIRITNTITDFDGTAITPTSHIIKLLKADGTQEGSNYTGPTAEGSGVFHQNIVIPPTGVAGIWTLEWKITYLANDSFERVKFKVVG